MNVAVKDLTAAGPDHAGGLDRYAAAARVSAAQIKMSLSLWGANFVAFTLANLLSGSHRIAQAGAVRLATFVFGLALCYGMHRLLRQLRKRGFRTRAIVLGIVALAAAETHAWVTFFAFSWLNNAKLAFTIGNWNEAILSLAMWTWFFVAWAGLYMGIEYSTEVKEEERRSAELRELAHAAKLRALHNQINPHFLFNALNSVSTLILDKRGADAETLLVRLSAIFRRTLATDPTTDIPLRDELQLQLEYLEIERTRYQNLTVTVDIPDKLMAAAIPALLIQPLLENAIKHGVACSNDPAHILIAAQENKGVLSVTIENSSPSGGRRAKTPSGGIGLRNVRERLAERFGDRQSFAAGANGNGMFRVMFALPLKLLE